LGRLLFLLKALFFYYLTRFSEKNKEIGFFEDWRKNFFYAEDL